MSFKVAGATIDDRRPVPDLMQRLQGWLFGDKGYIGEEFAEMLKK